MVQIIFWLSWFNILFCFFIIFLIVVLKIYVGKCNISRVYASWSYCLCFNCFLQYLFNLNYHRYDRNEAIFRLSVFCTWRLTHFCTRRLTQDRYYIIIQGYTFLGQKLNTK